MAACADHNEPRAIQLGADHHATNRRQPAGQVHGIDDNHLTLGQFRDGIGAGRYAEHLQQDLDGVVGVHAGAVVHVVGADHRAREFLQQVGFFVGAAWRAQEGKRIGPVLASDGLQPGGDETERLVPADLFKPPLLLKQRALQTVRRTGDFVDMPAAQADSPLVRGVRHAGIDTHDLVALSLQIETATHSTERASSELGGHESCPTTYYRVPKEADSAARTVGCDE